MEARVLCMCKRSMRSLNKKTGYSVCGGVFCLSLKMAFGKYYTSICLFFIAHPLIVLDLVKMTFLMHLYTYIHYAVYIFILRSIINFWNRSMSDNVIWQQQLLRPQNIYLAKAKNLMHLHTCYNSLEATFIFTLIRQNCSLKLRDILCRNSMKCGSCASKRARER